MSQATSFDPGDMTSAGTLQVCDIREAIDDLVAGGKTNLIIPSKGLQRDLRMG